MQKRIPYHTYRLYGDISGSIKTGKDIAIGVILFNESYRKQFIDDFYSTFPNLSGFKDKATKLTGEKLKNVINFMDNKRVHMTCVKCDRKTFDKCKTDATNMIRKLLNREPATPHFDERALSILYYYALKHKAYKNYVYEGQICIETQIKIDKVLAKIASLSQTNNYNIFLSPNYRRIQHMLKFADFVASAGRRLDSTFLDGKNYFNLIKPDIDKEHIKLVFGINKIVYDIKHRLDRPKNL